MLGWRGVVALVPRAATAAAAAAAQQQQGSLLGGPAALQTAWAASAAPPWPRRGVSASAAAQQALGIVGQLRDARDAGVAEAAAATMRELRWEVVRFGADGAASEVTASPDSLGLHPRDVYLFEAETSSGLSSGAMLAPRAGHYVFIAPACRAVVARDHAVLWPGPREADTVRTAQVRVCGWVGGCE